MQSGLEQAADDTQKPQSLNAPDGFGGKNQASFIKPKQLRQVPIPKAQNNIQQEHHQRVPSSRHWQVGRAVKAAKKTNENKPNAYNEETQDDVSHNPADCFNPLQAGVCFWRDFVRIHGAKDKPVNSVSQVFFIEKQ